MQKISIGPYDAGQRLDKFLAKYFKEAEKGFLYKMLRKKNITLNGKKAEGAEKLEAGDELCFFFSDETYARFRGDQAEQPEKKPAAAKRFNPGMPEAADASKVRVIYEDAQVICMDKPAGMLSQKSEEGDISLCEHLEAYLRAAGGSSSLVFKAGVANRLDRNTSGLVMAGKTLPGQQLLAALLKSRQLRKYYLCLVKGQPKGKQHSRVFLQKDSDRNIVTVRQESVPDADAVEIEFEPLQMLADGFSLLKVRLITGKTHQIRAQLAYLGYPVLGDKKYGDAKVNKAFADGFGYPLRHQLLHAWQIIFPDDLGEKLAGASGAIREEAEILSGKCITAPLPLNFHKCLGFLGGE